MSPERLDWSEWTYAEWNRQLISHHLIDSGSLLHVPVERIPATAEELVVLIGDSTADPSSVADTFVARVRGEVPYGQESFSGYCLDYRGWAPDSLEYPHFFGMLWFTCLIAYGYPRPDISFYPRLHEALGKKDNLQYRSGDQYPSCLPRLWGDLRDWTCKCRRKSAPVRELVLPTYVGRRRAHGYSWFLAFPHQQDRLELARSLWEADLVGPEPPIEPVVRILQSRRDRFSSEFREDLDDFVNDVLNQYGEVKSSAFWRAVRQEALEPSVTVEGERLQAKVSAGIVVFASDEGLRPILCAPDEWVAPYEYERQELDEPVGTLTHYFRTREGSLAEPAERALILGELVGFAHRNLIRQGLLVLREVYADVYAIVSGTEVNGASLALVRDEVVQPFCEQFGGMRTRGLVDGWWEVAGCVVQRLTTLPQTLAGVNQLLATMQPPTLSAVGGIRVAEGFYRFDSYLPHVRAYGADRVWVETNDLVTANCTRMPDEGEWALPQAWLPSRGTIAIKAEWQVDGGSARTTELRLHFVDYVLDDQLKSLRAGSYVLEGCESPEREVVGGGPVPLDLMTDAPERSTDLLELDGTVRYLGPGLGEMALQPTPGFDWMVTGANRSPDLLVFVGMPDSPTMPAMRRSPNAGDRRHWRQALSGPPAVVRIAPGRYASIGDYPTVRDARAAYRRHADRVPHDAPECEVADLQVLDAAVRTAVSPDPITTEAINALTAWSVRKGGLTYNDASVLVEPLVGSKNPLAVQQLLRAWAECGLLDIVRDSRSGRLTAIGRPALLVRIRRGPEVEATVFGLLSEHRERRLREVTRPRPDGVRCIEVRPPNPFQPLVYRLRGNPAAVERLGREAGIGGGGWLSWPTLSALPDVFSVQRGFAALPYDEPPASYKLNAIWNWEKLIFERCDRTSSPAGVEIQRRTHADGTSVYTVLSDARVVCRSYLRNWALLFGYEWSGRRPFRRDETDALSCEGISPVHLPLPIARLCTLTGIGLPGPKFAEGKVRAYSYPFGRRLFRLVERVIPPAWVQRADAGA